jgi:hypothetical protein
MRGFAPEERLHQQIILVAEVRQSLSQPLLAFLVYVAVISVFAESLLRHSGFA